MNLLEYASTSEVGTGTVECPVFAAIAALAGCSVQTLYQIALGHKQPGPQLAGRIEQATNGRVTRNDLRPDIFGPLQTAA